MTHLQTMKKLSLICFALAFTLSSIQAQELWTLEQCVNHALEKSLDVELASLSTQNSELTLKQSKESRYPSLNGSAGLNGNFGRSIDPVTNNFESQQFYSNGLSLNGGVLLYNGGRISKGIKQSGIDLEAAKLDEQANKNTITLNVVNSFLQVLLSQENMANAQDRFRVVQEQLENTNKLVEAGALARADLLNIEAQLAREEQNITTAQNTVELNKLALKQLLWLEPDFNLAVVAPAELDVQDYLQARMFNDVYISAINQLPEIKANELRVKSAKLGEEIAKTGKLPSITAGYGAGTNWSSLAKQFAGISGTERVPQPGVFIDNSPILFETTVPIVELENTPFVDQLNNNINYRLNLNASIPIYNNGQNRIAIQRAKLNSMSSVISNEQGKQTIKTNVQTAIANHRAAIQQYQAASKSLESLKLAADNAQVQFDLGAINSFDLLNSQNLYQQVQSEVLLAKYDLIFREKLIDFYMGIPIRL